MSYEKQHFVKGQVLKADHLNHMEDGIAEAMDPAVGIPGAAGDGTTDDTAALTAALNQSNCVIDGGNKKYKYLSVTMTNVENLTVKNVIFWKGQTLEVAGCKNIRFENCVWEGINCNDDTSVWTCGIRLRERKDADGNEIWCENIWIEHCVFRDIWYNPNLNNGHGVEISGQAILPRSVHNLFIKNNFFTQVKGNACIHWNTYKKCGYAEITDNTFYLNGLGGVCVYAVQQQFPKVKGKICNNQFIGCGLGYMPDSFFDAYPAEQQGLGCAALLGGASTRACPYKWHFLVENNVFEDNVESSIEGPTWNPCIGNTINGQGALQTEENCRKMEEKYHLDYKLHMRIINSVNFIYRNYYRDVDGTFPNEDNDPIVYQNNVMGIAHVARASYIQFKGEYNVPVIFTGNVMRTGLTQGLDTHFLFCDFKDGFRFENNDGIYPYFNNCTFEGDVVLDDILSAYRCDFSKANLITNNSRERFPETRTALYDPSRMVLENDQATAENGYAVLRSYDIPETVEKPTDTAYDITSADGYTEADGYAFGGPGAPNHIDTGIQLLKDGGDFTIFLKFDGNATTNIEADKSPIMPLFTVYNASGAGVSNAASYRLTVGGEWANVATVYKTKSQIANLWQSGNLTMKSMQLLVRRNGTKLDFWAMLQGATADDLTAYYVSHTIDESADQFADFEGTLYIGAPDKYFSDSDAFALWGKMKAFQLFSRALSDGEVSTLLYGKVFESGKAEEPTPMYDISTDDHYSAEDSAVTFDGSFGIDTGVQLFKDSSDWTVICKFQLDNYHDEGLKNFNFIPVLSSMNYNAENRKNSPGFDIGLFLASGSDPDVKPTGGFVNWRNSWNFANSAILLNSYFGYSGQDIGMIVIRKNGVISVYDFNMQKKATLSGADATTVFDGTLHIGENMTAPPLGDNNKLKGKVCECKVYDEALSTSVLETMFPNLYSNEKRTKGAVRCVVPSLRYSNQLLRYLFLEAMIDMGKYSAAEYAGKYPKAVGIRVDGVQDIIWCPTGSNTHIKQVFYVSKNIGPYGTISAEIVNTGLAPGLEATVKAFRCAVLTEDLGFTESSDALDFVVEWDKEELAVEVGGTLTGHVSYLPEDANSGTSLTLTVTGDAATAEFKDDMITVTGAKNGEATIEALLPSGAQKVFTVKVGTGVADTDPTVEVKSVALNKSAVTMTVGTASILTATVLPPDATNKTVTWSVEPKDIVTLSAESGERITVTGTAEGTANVTAAAGGKSAVCAVTVEAAAVTPEEEDVPGETPVYKLAEAKTFVPANKEYIDTGIKMFESIDPKPDWTILFEAQYDENVTAGPNLYVLMHCMEETSPWPGLAVQMVGDGALQVNVYSSKAGLGTLSTMKEEKHKFALVISDETLTRWTSQYSHDDYAITGYTAAVDKSLLLGCYQQSDGTKGRFFDGTLYQCLVYNKALTDDQISAWMAK